jgi:hypothetical protein
LNVLLQCIHKVRKRNEGVGEVTVRGSQRGEEVGYQGEVRRGQSLSESDWHRLVTYTTILRLFM